MIYNRLLADIEIGDELEGYYILKDAIIKTATNGKTFLSGTLSDKSGSCEMKVWDYSGKVGTDSTQLGKVVKIRGEVSEYRGTLQLTVSHIRFAGENDTYDVSNLVPVAPIDVEAEVARFYALIDSLEDEDYRRVCRVLLERHIDRFKKIPAAKSVHHSFLSGLLMHTANMLKSAEFLSTIYSNIINRSLLIAGTMLHDFAKEYEFAFSELGIVTDYSTKGQLLGHLVMGAAEVAEVCKEYHVPEEKSVLLQHMLLSHHGEPEFGAAVKPMCAEAELLSCIDIIDSRMQIYTENLADMEIGKFSGRIFALDKKIYKHK